MKLSTDETAAFAKLHSELTAPVSDFESFVEYQTQMNNFARKMKDICSGSPKEVEANVTGLRLQTLFNQIFESPSFQSFKLRQNLWWCFRMHTNEEIVESDESSLNDFHQDSVDSSNDCANGKKEIALPDATASENTPKDVDKDVAVSSVPSLSIENGPEISAPVEIAPEPPVEPTLAHAQPVTTPIANKDNSTDSKPKEPVNGEHRNRRSQNNNYHRNRRDHQHKTQNQQAHKSMTAKYSRGGPRPYNNNYKPRRNSVPNNTNDQDSLKPSSDSPAGNTARPEGVHQAPRQGNGNNGHVQNRRSYVPRNQQNANGDQHQAQRNGGPSNNGGGYAPRNYERVPRVHQPYECGLRFARD
uniref:Uncharacterized protein n=1 Tax=Ditylenchus dipsaci TaxID=166011 RepID=A0A915EGB7_9BILA